MSDVAIEATAESNTLRMQRVFKAPRAIVFDAFTDRNTFKTWWGPKGATAEVDELDATVGGKYRVRMIMPDGKIHRLSGTYMEVDTPNRLVYSWVWGQGELEGLEMTVALDFKDHPDGTELFLEHSGLPSEEAAKLHSQGWGSCLECLDEVLV